jgi:Na+-translocating ferredoxin:NAD+ oxidoreductase subunit G
VLKVVPGAESMKPVDEDVYAALDASGKPVGYALAGQGPGFQDTIRLIYGYDPARRTVTGLEILDSRETPGLGDKIFKDQAFVDTFKALTIDPEIKLVKPKTRAATNEVDAITGATISSRAVVKIINDTNARSLGRLP